MKDIDFDELDKAVNSLMGGLKDESDGPKPKTLTISSTLKDDEKPEYSNIEEAARKIGNEAIISPVENTAVIPDSNGDDTEPKIVELASTLAASEPVAPAVPESPVTPPAVTQPVVATREATPVSAPPRPQTGRFMDVMHPSSDMKPVQDKPAGAPSVEVKSAPAPQSAKVSHFGASLDAPAAVVTGDTISTPAVAPATSGQLAPTMDTTSQSSVDSKEEAPVEESPEEPLVSPFLPDAKDKVEKRPLGTAATAKDDTFDPVVMSNIDSSETQIATDPDTANTLPEELNGDLMAIETNLADEADILPEKQTPPLTQADTLTGSESVLEKRDDVEALGSSDPSVKERYEEHPNVDDQPEGAIFDTSAYQQSVNHPAKSTPAWVWIVAIVLIILVCAGGAAAFYLMSI